MLSISVRSPEPELKGLTMLDRMAGGLGAIVVFVIVGLQIALFAGGVSYRKDCITDKGTEKRDWNFTILSPVPYLFRPSEDGCQVHTGARVAMNAIGLFPYRPTRDAIIADVQ